MAARYMIVKEERGRLEVVSRPKDATESDARQIAASMAEDARREVAYHVVRVVDTCNSKASGPEPYECKLDASGWQLYSSQKSSEVAALCITEEFNRLLAGHRADLEREPRLDRVKLAREMQADMRKVMQRFASDGATDTEPDCVLCEELEEAFGLPESSITRW